MKKLVISKVTIIVILNLFLFIQKSYGQYDNRGIEIEGTEAVQRERTERKTNNNIIDKTSFKITQEIWAQQGIRVLTPEDTPRLFILSIGISSYDYGYDKKDECCSEKNKKLIKNLMVADHDAKSIVEALEKNAKKGKFKLYQVIPNTLINHQATTINILKKFETLKKAGKNDTVIIFLAGHAIKREGKYYYVTYNTNPLYPHAAAIRGIDLEDLVKNLRENNGVKRIIMIIDTCHAADSMNIKHTALNRSFTEGSISMVSALKMIEGVSLFASSLSEEKSREDTDEYRGHGAFTYYLLKAIEFGDTDENGLLTLGEWFDYTANNLPFKGQIPVNKIIGDINNLPIAVVGKVRFGNGSIAIDAYSCGEVKIDGTSHGKTPIAKREIKAGKHRLEIKINGENKVKTIEIKKGEFKFIYFSKNKD